MEDRTRQYDEAEAREGLMGLIVTDAAEDLIGLEKVKRFENRFIIGVFLNCRGVVAIRPLVPRGRITVTLASQIDQGWRSFTGLESDV